MDLNRVCLTGRLTRDAEIKELASGSTVANFSVAVMRRVERGEEWVDEASFFDCAFFGRSVAGLGPYLVRGKQVAIDGSLRLEKWEKDGQPRSKVSISCQSVQLLGSRSDDAEKEPQKFNADIPF